MGALNQRARALLPFLLLLASPCLHPAVAWAPSEAIIWGGGPRLRLRATRGRGRHWQALGKQWDQPQQQQRQEEKQGPEGQQQDQKQQLGEQGQWQQQQQGQGGWQQQQHQNQERQQRQGGQGEEEGGNKPMEGFLGDVATRSLEPTTATRQSRVPSLTTFWTKLPLPFLQALLRISPLDGRPGHSNQHQQQRSELRLHKHYRKYRQYVQGIEHRPYLKYMKYMQHREPWLYGWDRQHQTYMKYIEGKQPGRYGRDRQHRTHTARRALLVGGADGPEASGNASAPSRVSVKRASGLPIVKCSADPGALLNASDFNAPEAVNWVPQRDRYLLPICQFGRLSNQLMCMRYYFWFAGLLNRTLIVPRIGYKDGMSRTSYWWKWESLLDASAVRYCLSGESKIGGKGSEAPPHVVTMDEYLTLQKKECLNISRSFAFIPASLPHFDATHQIPGACEFKGPTEALFPNGTAPHGHRVTPADLDHLRTVADPVISLGSLFSEAVEGHDIRAPLSPFRMRQGCQDLWSPHPDVMSLVDRITTNFTGNGSYAAMHLRRGDFARHYKETYPTIPEIADILHQWLEPLNVSLLYISSNGTPTEMQNLEELLTGSYGPVEEEEEVNKAGNQETNIVIGL